VVCGGMVWCVVCGVVVWCIGRESKKVREGKRVWKVFAPRNGDDGMFVGLYDMKSKHLPSL
jgi:hypothetical protein